MTPPASKTEAVRVLAAFTGWLEARAFLCRHPTEHWNGDGDRPWNLREYETAQELLDEFLSEIQQEIQP